MKKFCVSIIMLLTTMMTVSASVPVYPVPKMKSAPAMDGKNSDAWAGASVQYGFYQRFTSLLETRRGRTLFGYDDNNLYFRVETELPPGKGKLVDTVRHRDGKVYMDDNVEIWVAPKGHRYYYQWIVNLSGTVYDSRHTIGGGVPDESWNAAWKHKSFVDEEKQLWILELAVPFKELGIKGDPDGREFGVLVARIWQQPTEQTPFIINRAPFDDHARFARFIMDPKAPSIQIDSLGQLEKQLFDLTGTVRNNSGRVQDYTLNFHFTHSDMPENNAQKTLTLKPGETKPFRFRYDGNFIHLNATHQAYLSILSNGENLYSTTFPYKMPIDRANAWKTPDLSKTQFRISVYPGMNKAGINYSAAEKTDRAIVNISSAGKNIFRKTFSLKKGDNTVYFDIPELRAGKYVLSLSLPGKDGKRQVLKQEFVRNVFPWENNTLGITEKIYPPFKALQFNKNKVKTVLNEYVFDPSGLYAEVNPEGEKLLNGKAAWHFSADGRSGRLTDSAGKFARMTDQAGIFEGEVRSDAGFRIKTSAKTEYDGCTRFEATLMPVSGKAPTIDRLYMDIPLDSRQIRLFHVVKSGTVRSNPAIKIPEGQGVIWKSSDLSNCDFFGNMHIYLWLGEQARGLAWFADNDRNFFVDDELPVQELIRKGDTLTLRIYFVNKRLQLTGPRTFVFGMQASPVKPMPKDWRNPKLVIPPHGNSNPLWGIRPHYAGKYPVNYDWNFVDEMVKARESGKINKAYLEQFLAKYYGNYPKDIQQWYRRAIYRGHDEKMARIGKNPTMLYFEEHCQDQSTPEWETFQDEWSVTAFTARKWVQEKDMISDSVRAAAGCRITPVKSYQDFALWYAREWLKRGIGIYCDNSYPQNSFDRNNSDAYIRPDGMLQPSSNIWNLREYHKRLWVLTKQMQESVKWPLMVSLHTTNAMVLPINAWTDIQLDLEWGWSSGYKPFPPELLEVETTGRQIGAYPQAHFPVVGNGLVHENASSLSGKINKAMVNTDWAMRMIYGVLRYNIRGEDFTALNKIVNDFGLGSDACKVYDYWQKDYPVRVTPETVKSVLLVRGKKAILILASWNEKPVIADISGRDGFVIRSAEGKIPQQKYAVSNGTVKVKLEKYGMQLLMLDIQ